MIDIFKIVEIALANIVTLVAAYIIYKIETRDNIVLSIYNPLYSVFYELSELIDDTVEGYKSLHAFNVRYRELVRWLDEILINRGGLIKILEDDKELGNKIMELSSYIYHMYVLTQELSTETLESTYGNNKKVNELLDENIKELNALLNDVRDILHSRLKLH